MHKDSFTIAPFQYITVDHPEMTHAQQAARAYSAGCQWVQIRIKDRPLNEIEREVVQALESALAYNAVLIVDDYVSLAEKCKASGVHLGKLDMSPTEARQILGNHCIIGATANTFDDIRQITTMPVDYIGVGPFRFTRTKKKLSPIIGIEGYRSLMKHVMEARLTIPIIAIGGITYEDLPALIDTGVYGVAVSAAVAYSHSFEKSIEKFVEFFTKTGQFYDTGVSLKV